MHLELLTTGHGPGCAEDLFVRVDADHQVYVVRRADCAQTWPPTGPGQTTGRLSPAQAETLRARVLALDLQARPPRCVGEAGKGGQREVYRFEDEGRRWTVDCDRPDDPRMDELRRAVLGAALHPGG